MYKPLPIEDWSISYNPYTDVFQMFDEAVFKVSVNKLDVNRFGDIKVAEGGSNKPLLIEIHNASDFFKGDIDSMAKDDIVKLITKKLPRHYVGVSSGI